MLKDRFIGFLLGFAKALVLIVLVAFAFVSFLTTYTGFLTLFATWPAMAASAGLQCGMLASGIFFSHNRAPYKRIAWLGVWFFAFALSVTFSFVGLRADYEKAVRKQEAPIRAGADFASQQASLAVAVARERGRALARVDAMIADHQSLRGVAELSREARRLRAAQYRRGVTSLEEQETLAGADSSGRQLATDNAELERKIQEKERLLSVAEASGESLELEILEQKSTLGQLQDIRRKLIAYRPDFFNLPKDRNGQLNWRGLRERYNRFLQLLNEVPGAKSFAASIPPAPGPHLLTATGGIIQGEDHPIKEAFEPIRRGDSAYIFLLLLAISFDLVPFAFTLALRPRLRNVPDSIFAIGSWMYRVRLGLETIQGIFPFAFKAARQILFGAADRIGHPAVLRFENSLAKQQTELSEALQTLVLPDTLSELILLEFSYLRSRAVTISSEQAGQFQRVALNVLERCLVAERNAIGVSADARADLEQFLTKGINRFIENFPHYVTEEGGFRKEDNKSKAHKQQRAASSADEGEQQEGTSSQTQTAVPAGL